MSSTSPLGNLWLKWKALKLPWRKRWLADRLDHPHLDASSNLTLRSPTLTFKSRVCSWLLSYVPPELAAERFLIAQWHQWLRYTRSSPPTIAEQQSDTVRQIELKRLARLADERWASKTSVLDNPRVTMLPGSDLGKAEDPTSERGELDQRKDAEERKETQWKGKQGNPGERWQPRAWTPGSLKR